MMLHCNGGSSAVGGTLSDTVVPEIRCDTTKDRGWSWVVLLASFLLHTIAIGVGLSSGLFIVEFMEVFDTGQGETSWIASLQLGMAYLIGAPLSGPVCQRFSHRFSIILGSIILSSGTFISAFSGNIIHLYIFFGLMAGVGIGLIYSPSISIIGHYFDRRLAMAIGITVAGGGCGSILFSQIFYYLIDAYGWRGALILNSGLMLNCCALGTLMLPRVASEPYSVSTVVSQNGPHKTSVVKQCKKSFVQDLSLVKDLRFTLFFLSSFLFCYATLAVFILLFDYVISCGVSPRHAALLLSLTGALSTLGRFMMAGLMHCLRSPRVIHLYNFSTLFCGLAVLMVPLGNGVGSFAVLCSLFGFCYGGCCSSSPVVAAEFFGVDRLSTVYGYTLIACGLGCLLGPPITGWIYSATSNYQLTMLLNGATIVSSFVVLVPLYVLFYC